MRRRLGDDGDGPAGDGDAGFGARGMLRTRTEERNPFGKPRGGERSYGRSAVLLPRAGTSGGRRRVGGYSVRRVNRGRSYDDRLARLVFVPRKAEPKRPRAPTDPGSGARLAREKRGIRPGARLTAVCRSRPCVRAASCKEIPVPSRWPSPGRRAPQPAKRTPRWPGRPEATRDQRQRVASAVRLGWCVAREAHMQRRGTGDVAPSLDNVPSRKLEPRVAHSGTNKP